MTHCPSFAAVGSAPTSAAVHATPCSLGIAWRPQRSVALLRGVWFLRSKAVASEKSWCLDGVEFHDDRVPRTGFRGLGGMLLAGSWLARCAGTRRPKSLWRLSRWVSSCVEHVADIDDIRLSLYRPNGARRDHDAYETQLRQMASSALRAAGRHEEAQLAKSKSQRMGRLPCIVSVHYSWDCLEQLRAAQAVGFNHFVGSALVPACLPEELLKAVGEVTSTVYVVEPEVLARDLPQDVPWRSPEQGMSTSKDLASTILRPWRALRAALGRPSARGTSSVSEAFTSGEEGGGGATGDRNSRLPWRRFEGAVARGTVRFAVAFPLSTPLRSMRPPFIIFDGLTSSSNVGQILRTAYHLGVTSVVASAASWNCLNGRACRVSKGWMYFMDFHRAQKLPAALAELQELGVRVYAAENQFPSPVAPHSPLGDRRWALVVGHEDAGVSAEAVAASDARVCVPQRQGQSLNVAHAAGICMYELSRHMDN